MSSPARPARGTVSIRLTGGAADCDALAAILARQKDTEILTGPDGPTQPAEPGDRLYLTVRLTAHRTDPGTQSREEPP